MQHMATGHIKARRAVQCPCAPCSTAQGRPGSLRQPHLKVLLAGGGLQPRGLLKLLPRAQQEALAQQLLACGEGQGQGRGRGPGRRGGRMWAGAACRQAAAAWRNSSGNTAQTGHSRCRRSLSTCQGVGHHLLGHCEELAGVLSRGEQGVGQRAQRAAGWKRAQAVASEGLLACSPTCLWAKCLLTSNQNAAAEALAGTHAAISPFRPRAHQPT